MFGDPNKEQRIEPWIQIGKEQKERYDVLLSQGVPHDLTISMLDEYFRWLLISTPNEVK